MLRRALRPAAIACSGFYVTRNDGPRDDDARVKQLLKQTDKARQHAQERVPHAGTFMMGVVPKQWLEVLDEKHRYGSILYPYWQRWEASRTRMSFFMWLDEGRGCLVDLPDCPRRFLEECEVRDAAEARYGLPSELPEATWGAVARALDHDDGLAGSPGRKRPLPASRTAQRHLRRPLRHMYARARTSTTRSSRTGAASASTSRRRRSAGY
ncbi:IQ calmodulin-binding motif-containing protein [Aureococcus anophagefferens]|nr:IQ calmodulin-binding motif-containing protein [Aureococcus anophagefferens]